MRITEQTAGALVIEDRPWLEALVAMLFVAGGGWAFFGGERVLGGGFVLAGMAIGLLFANTITIGFDRRTGRFTRSIKGLVRNDVVAHPLEQISGVDVEAGASGNPSRSYRVCVLIKDGARVPLTSAYSSGREDKARLAAEVRRFLGLPDPPPGMPGFGEMVKLMREP